MTTHVGQYNSKKKKNLFGFFRSFDSPMRIYTYSVVSDTPAGDTNTVLHVKARVHRFKVVRVGGALDVELGDGALRGGGAESLHGVLDVDGGGPAVAVGKVL